MDPVTPGTVSDAEMGGLLRLVGWTEAHAANLPGLRRAIAGQIDGIVRRFYDHLDTFAELADVMAEPKRRARLERVQRAYLLAFGRGIGEPGYGEVRLRIGAAHEQAGLAPRWFLGAASALSTLIGEALAEEFGVGNLAFVAHEATLDKVLQVDTILSVEAYHRIAMARQGILVRDLETTRRRLERTVQTDSLTGLRARQALIEDLTAEYDRAARFARPLTVLFIDVDRFKVINDLNGHSFGDDVLRHVARTLAGALRPADLVGRYGGEEFVVGLVECDGPAAAEVAERLRAAVANATLVGAGFPLVPTVSIGLAARDADTRSLDDLLNLADAAMYRAKRSGRNRVAIAMPAIEDGPPVSVVA